MTSPQIIITPALATDAPTLAALHFKSFSSDGGLQTSSLPPNRPLTAAETAENLAWRTARFTARIQRQDFVVFKAVDQAKGNIVGCVALKFPKTSASAGKKDGEDVEDGSGGGGGVGGERPKARYDGAPSFLDMTVFSEMEAKASAAREKHIGDEREVWCESSSLFCNRGGKRRTPSLSILSHVKYTNLLLSLDSQMCKGFLWTPNIRAIVSAVGFYSMV
jgi:hypothetical protein